jgi:CheY-like chemotaxis protein
MLDAGKGGSLKVRVYAKDGAVHAEFHDSGPGIKEPNRIFEPFYTTKTVGKGTGLGLSICYGIIQEHGGTISARNRGEGGATIEVCLPAASQAVTEGPAAAPLRRMALTGRILLIESEEAVLEFERDVLAGAGAEVTTASSGADLDSLLRDGNFDALIMDGKMPGGSGTREIYDSLTDRHPGMEKHLLFTFSNMAEPDVRSFLHNRNVPYLVKPFEVAELISQARRIAQKARAAGAD